MIRVIIQRTQDADPRLNPQHCCLCDGGYDAIATWYASVESGPLAGIVVCPECLKSPNLHARILARIELLESCAQDLMEFSRRLRNPLDDDWELPDPNRLTRFNLN